MLLGLILTGMTLKHTLPEDSVGGAASVCNVVEKDLQLLVVVKISSNDGANRGWCGKGLCGNIL